MELGPYKDRGKLSHSMTSYEFIEHFNMALATRSNIAKQKFSFIKRVDKGWITTVKDLESWRFER